MLQMLGMLAVTFIVSGLIGFKLADLFTKERQDKFLP